MSSQAPPSPETIAQMARQRYVPFDYLYGAHPAAVSLFLPPSRLVLGVLARGLPEPAPLELAPVEYMAWLDEEGRFEYLRPAGGHQGRLAWSFPDDQRALCTVRLAPFELRFCFCPLPGGEGVLIEGEVENQGPRAARSLYFNPCLRYQNLAPFRATGHGNISLAGAGCEASLADLAREQGGGPRLLALAAGRDPQAPHLKPLVDSLMASRMMSLVQDRRVRGRSILCRDRESGAGLCLGWDRVLGYFSRSGPQAEENGCLHVIPLLEDLGPGQARATRGALLWGNDSGQGLAAKCESLLGPETG